MQATINLLPRKCFEITLEDGAVIKGQFGTWALKRFCDKLKLSLTEVGERLGNPGLGDMVEYILSAVEFAARKEGAAFSFTDVHACEWIDQLGGIGGESLGKLFAWSGDDSGEEKKTEGVT